MPNAASCWWWMLLDAAGSCWMMLAELSASKFQLSAVAQPGAYCKGFCAETDTECIAHSGVIPEPLLTHDPSPSLQVASKGMKVA